MDDPRLPATDTPLRRSAPPVAPRAVRLLCLLALCGLAAWLARQGGTQIDRFGPDFEYFYKAGAWLLHHGTLDPGFDRVDGQLVPRGRLDWYWPCVSRFMTLLALLPFQVAGYIWLILKLVAFFATLRLLGRYLTGLPPQDWPVTQLVPALALLVYWLWEFKLNQINMFTLLLMVASFVHWQEGRRQIAGFWLGLAVLLKITPGLIVIWFALKRQFRTAGVAVVTILLAGPVSDLFVLTPGGAVDAYRGWLRGAVTEGSQRGLILRQREMDWRNQSIGAVLSRWLHPTNYNTRFDNDPRHQAQYGEREPRTMNVLAWPRATIAHLASGLTLIILLGVIALSLPAAHRMTAWQLRIEWALWVLTMLALMPVLRRYHMVFALPALSVLAAAVHHVGLRDWWSRLTLTCFVSAAVAQLSVFARPVEAAGTILLSVLVLALPLVLLHWRLKGKPHLLPPPIPDNKTQSPADASDGGTPSGVLAHV